MTAPVRQEGDDLLLVLHVQPGAAQTAMAGRHGDALKIRLASPPVDGRANRELCRFLAEVCAVAPSAVTVVSGESARRKRVRICAPASVPAALKEFM